ncbi:hypothetical protein MLD38_026374 [Melastoma candidum]|uniref:Uncharacterized protein n=1 Tax=Melastoma candidum TaxID=119954 RepID=A0ACB9NYD4_9MYRT|nr:hypothetical protein MLD38_026374 [Melastoma candidum]
MLVGRESLVRLIGKRRKFLPNRESLLASAPLVQSCLHCDLDKDGNIDKDDDAGVIGYDASSDMSAAESVVCPVCGKEIKGGNYNINSHLDTCLLQGTKRKLTQRTLLQLDFRRGSKIKICSKELEQSPDTDNSVLDSCLPTNVDTGDPLVDTYVIPSADNNTESICKNAMSVHLNTPHLPIKGAHDNFFGASTNNEEAISGTILDTFIVGRKFSNVEVTFGMKVSLMREPENVKDPNAVKVFSTDLNSHLGYLPRSLAQFMSPLMDRHLLCFEGCVASLPVHHLDIVAIKISCQNCEKSYQDIEDIKYLWSNVLQEIENSKRNPPNLTKYQQNFLIFVNEILLSSSYLFTEDEKIFMESFTSLSNDSQRLFIRLYSRKGPWFPMSKISYPEISNVGQAIDDLSAKEFMLPFEPDNGHTDDLAGILGTLNVSELHEVRRLHVKGKFGKGHQDLRKKDIIALLVGSYKDGLCPLLPSMLLEKIGPFVKVSPRAQTIFWRAERLFFLNGEQDLSTFLLVDLGAIKYASYNCTVSDKIFVQRNDLLAYEEAIEVAQLLDESIDENEVENIFNCVKVADSRLDTASGNFGGGSRICSSASFLFYFTPSWVYSKVVLVGVSYLEQGRRYNDAVALLKRLLGHFPCDGRRGYWTVRLSINLEHLGFINESISVVEAGLKDPWVRAGSRMTLQKRILRLAKPPRRWKLPISIDLKKQRIKEVHVQGRPLNCETGKKNRFYGEDGQQCGVEELALQYYANEGGWSGIHTESGIWLTLFGVMMWDIIFSDVPNVFQTRFQTAPWDLETDSFYLARRDPIESHLQRIHAGMGEEILITFWESHKGTACRGVNWEQHSLCELRAAVTCVGGPCLAAIFRLLAQDYRSWSSGMPDLLLWRFCGEYSGEAKLVEVKGPNDRLSEQQRAWLLVLIDCGFDAEVCKITPSKV